MTARVLMGYQKKKSGASSWQDWERSDGFPTFHKTDMDIFRMEAARLGAKSVLEFGPGDSTEEFAKMGLRVTTVEHIEKWYLVAKERFKDNPNVRVLKGNDEMPFTVEGLNPNERFDIAFVDAPQGYYPLRKIHKGYEDCSRFNSTLFALERAPVVLLHDASRPLERCTLNRLSKLGYKSEIITTPFSIARITHGDETRIDLPGTEKPGGTAAGSGASVGGLPECKRPRGRSRAGDGKEGRGVHPRRGRPRRSPAPADGTHSSVEGGS